MNKKEIIKEYKNYCKDKNYCCDKSDFIYDYIKYYYDLGKIKLSEIEEIEINIKNILKGVN